MSHATMSLKNQAALGRSYSRYTLIPSIKDCGSPRRMAKF
jgi:hypothetical protein